MKTGIKIAGALLPLVLLAVVLVACENDMDVLTPTDAVLNVWANPAAIQINLEDPNGPRDERGRLIGSTTVNAQLFDKNGYPLQNHIVYFSTDAGRMGSQGPPGSAPTPISTDANGIARDSLTVAEGDPQTVTVTAQSSSVTKEVSVTWHGDCTGTTTVTVTVEADSDGGTLTRHCSTSTTTTCTSGPPTPPDTCPAGETCCPTGQTCVVGGNVPITLTASAPTGSEGTYTWNCGASGVDAVDQGQPDHSVVKCNYNAVGTFTPTADLVNASGCPIGHGSAPEITIE